MSFKEASFYEQEVRGKYFNNQIFQNSLTHVVVYQTRAHTHTHTHTQMAGLD